jgi:hypothetical protein
MINTMKTENGILSIAAFACYTFALAACGVATYALVTLSLVAYGDLGKSFYLATSQF